MSVGSISASTVTAFAAQALAATGAPTPAATSAVDVQIHPVNPGQRYDVATGRFYVVFRDRQSGVVQFSIPSPNSVTGQIHAQVRAVATGQAAPASGGGTDTGTGRSTPLPGTAPVTPAPVAAPAAPSGGTSKTV